MTRNAYGDAYRFGFDRTVRFLISRGAAVDGAQEAAQAAWARGWERLHQLRDECMLCTWINTIALNLYRRIIKKETLNQPLLEIQSTSSINLGAMDVARILNISGPLDRKLFELQMRGFTTEEIARDYEVSENTIRIRMMRARRKAVAQLEKRAKDLRQAA